MYLVFDTETTGLPLNYRAPLTDFNNWPRMVQIAWQIHDIKGDLIEVKNYIIKPEGFTIPYNSEKIHGISTELAHKKGLPLKEVLSFFTEALNSVEFIIGHNISFDNNIVGCEFLRSEMVNVLESKTSIDTKEESTDFCQLPGGRGGKYKWPNLSELYNKLFGENFAEAHNASADVEATTRCFLELIRLSVIPFQKVGMDELAFQKFIENNTESIQLIGLNVQPYEKEDQNDEKDKSKEDEKIIETVVDNNIKSESCFSHLHVHSQYSILQASGDIDLLVNRAAELNMPAIGLTDHANMYGAYRFINSVLKHPINSELDNPNKLKLKPILGCELNVCANHSDKSFKDYGAQIPFLAKNKIGYHNLSKLSSLAYIDGFYYVPRVDKELVLKHKEGLIVFTGSLYGSIPNLILNVGEEQAEQEFKWWKENFGEDFYVEINRHGLDEEDHVNTVLIKLAKKYDVKLIASNNVYYVDKEDASSHDILLCVKDAEQKSTPIGKGRGFRYGFPNNEFYFKDQKEINNLFSDIPQAINNINEIIEKVEVYNLNTEVLLPEFAIPDNFKNDLDKEDGGKRGENAYLKHLTYEGAKERYLEINDEIKERIDFELETIEKSGYPGYFLIVQDFIAQARKMNVSVGPGRGSAAGSVVAYCTKITNVDPIKYDLLFERFLNPERISLPDIDIDFDDEGRSRVIDWVVEKYGKKNVAQIITFGTMAAKSSIRDTARVLDLPLFEADKMAKLVPDLMSLDKIFNYSDSDLKKNVKKDQLSNAKKLIDFSKGNDLHADTINNAIQLEGSVRNVGTHACGIIITPEPLIDLIPITNSKDSDLMVTQFDNSVVENAGLLKMDFLGLKNLTIIKDCVKIIQKLHNKNIDIDNLPLDDEKTYEIFKNGKTKGIFQFSSDGMRAHLKQLKPDKFDDLIAMNALYRPGPMEYIPNYIKRKHGKEEIVYDLPEMEDYLSTTYGITVYQEQVMLLSQKLANFSKGDADMLRKGMGKKIKSVLDKLKPKFFEGCEKNGFDIKVVEKIWTDWEAFASYAFNKSHSTCYALIAYQTAYLKAHYPAELMAAILTNHMKDIKDITLYMEECRDMGVKVLGPDINESFFKFAVNKEGEVRFGLGAIKGVGEGAVKAIVDERKENGNYSDFSDFVSRVDLRSANKRTLESLAYSGGFDSFGINRSQYFEIEKDQSYIEKMIKFGNKVQDTKNSNQFNMFGENSDSVLQAPAATDCEEWSTMDLLSKEKEVVGIYLSGHPLDDYRFEIDNFSNSNLSVLSDLQKIENKEIRLSGVIIDVEHKETQKGKKFGVLHMEDYHGAFKFFLFGDDYIKFKSFLTPTWLVHISGRVKKKFYNDDLEFKINNISLLSELTDSEVRDVVLKLELNSLTETLVDQTVKLVEKNKGKHSLIVSVIDSENNYKVDLLSRKLKVDINNDFVSEINSIQEVSLSVD